MQVAGGWAVQRRRVARAMPGRAVQAAVAAGPGRAVRVPLPRAHVSRLSCSVRTPRTVRPPVKYCAVFAMNLAREAEG